MWEILREMMEVSGAQVSKEKEYCKNRTCLTKTCSRHRCHHSGRYSKYMVWVDYGAKNCEIYKGIERFETMYKPPKRRELETED